MDLKHFHKVSVLKNCYPIGCGTEEDNKQDQHEFTLDFTCNTYHNSDIDSVVNKMRKTMAEGVSDPNGQIIDYLGVVSKDALDTGAYDTYMTPSATILADKLTEATEIISDIPDDRILKYLDEGFNSSKDDIE